MNWAELVKQIDPAAAQAFVRAARSVIDAMMVEGVRVRQAQAPGLVDYERAQLSREGPGGGWLSEDELRATSRALAESIAAERWVEGFALALRLLAGGVA